MKKFLNLAIAVIALAGMSACTKVPAGNVGIKVHLYGDDKGVANTELGPGRYWCGINEEIFTFPTFQQNYVWTKDADPGSPTDESITFQTVEGMEVNGDFGITYQVDPTKVSLLFQKFRKGLDEVTDGYLRNIVRDAIATHASKMPVASVYGEGKQAIIEKVNELVKAQVAPMGINVEKVYLIGSFRLPKQVIESLNMKIAATQKAEQRENELREAEAEAKKSIAKAEGDAQSATLKAQAEAKANELKRQSLTPELIQYEAIQKWDGKLPTMTGSGALPFIQIPATK